MKNKKFRLLWPTSKCCLKKFLDLQLLAKYGPIVVILMFISIQILNIFSAKNYEASFISLIINLFFLVVVLTKLEYLKIDPLQKYIDITLRIMIFIFFLNFIAYLGVEGFVYKYVVAPASFLGAYFVFLLLKKESI
jgi:quinol-cytochrome oxidoreductase complex cytochrome b subunit